MNRWRVAVVGSSTVSRDSEDYRRAELLGTLLGENGCDVVTGGYGGVMEAVSKGARAAGGQVIGATLLAFRDKRPNDFLTEEIAHADMFERIRTLIGRVNGVVVLDGGLGTLSELCMAWVLKEQKLITADLPIVVLGTRFRSLVESLGGFVRDGRRVLELLDFASDAEDSVTKLLEAM